MENVNSFDEATKKKKVDSSNAKCKNCGSNINYDPRSGKLKCDKCGSLFDFEKRHGQIKHYIGTTNEKYKEHVEWAKQLRMVKCQTCGAEIMLSNLDVTSSCPYCGSDYVVEKETLAGIKPDVVLPFSFDEEQANDIFIRTVKKKFFVPNALKKKLPIEKIRGLYIPAFTFDNNTVTPYSGTLEKIHHHTDSNGRSYTTTETFYIKGTYKMQFEDYVIESSSKMNDRELRALLPFNMDNSYEYSEDFIRGYSVEHYEDALNSCYSLAKKNMENIIRSRILSQYDYDNIITYHQEVNYFEELYSYRLMPIYVFEFFFNKKKYLVQMNGQSGKVGKGLPISPIKVGITVAISVILIGLIVLLILMSNN